MKTALDYDTLRRTFIKKKVFKLLLKIVMIFKLLLCVVRFVNLEKGHVSDARFSWLWLK